MKVILDHCVPRGFRRLLQGHDVKTSREMGWDKLQNGRLIRAAFDGGFDLFLSIDKKIQREQNLDKLPIAVVVLDALTNALPGLLQFVPHVQKLCSGPLEPILYVINPDGQVQRYGDRQNRQPT